jgi:hypothetical protein
MMSKYRLKIPGLGIVGPIGLQAASEIIECGTANRASTVSRDGGPFVGLATLDELRPFLEKAGSQHAAFTGALEGKTVLSVLYRLHRDAETGLLAVKDGECCKDLYLEDGSPIFLASNIPSERFGEYLILRKKLTRQNLEAALDAMERMNLRLGEVLIHSRLLDSADLAHELRRHQMERLIELCCWRKGTYDYYRSRAYPGEGPLLRLTVPKLVVTVAREMSTGMLLAAMHDRLALVPSLLSDAGWEAIPFDVGERRVLQYLDGTQDAAKILQTLAPDNIAQRRALTVLFILAETGALVFRAQSGE